MQFNERILNKDTALTFYVFWTKKIISTYLPFFIFATGVSIQQFNTNITNQTQILIYFLWVFPVIVSIKILFTNSYYQNYLFYNKKMISPRKFKRIRKLQDIDVPLSRVLRVDLKLSFWYFSDIVVLMLFMLGVSIKIDFMTGYIILAILLPLFITSHFAFKPISCNLLEITNYDMHMRPQYSRILSDEEIKMMVKLRNSFRFKIKMNEN